MNRRTGQRADLFSSRHAHSCAADDMWSSMAGVCLPAPARLCHAMPLTAYDCAWIVQLDPVGAGKILLAPCGAVLPSGSTVQPRDADCGHFEGVLACIMARTDVSDDVPTMFGRVMVEGASGPTTLYGCFWYQALVHSSAAPDAQSILTQKVTIAFRDSDCHCCASFTSQWRTR
eukprot:s832_g16.t1